MSFVVSGTRDMSEGSATFVTVKGRNLVSLSLSKDLGTQVPPVLFFAPLSQPNTKEYAPKRLKQQCTCLPPKDKAFSAIRCSYPHISQEVVVLGKWTSFVWGSSEATNIAETSLTVDGIKYVIDTGNAPVLFWSDRLGHFVFHTS